MTVKRLLYRFLALLQRRVGDRSLGADDDIGPTGVGQLPDDVPQDAPGPHLGGDPVRGHVRLLDLESGQTAWHEVRSG